MAKKFMEVAKAEGLQVNEVISANIVLSYIMESFTLLDFVGYEWGYTISWNHWYPSHNFL